MAGPILGDYTIRKEATVMAEDKKKDSVWSQYNAAEKQALESLNKGYREFLSTCKTEARECPGGSEAG
jgi:hypothetical protein